MSRARARTRASRRSGSRNARGVRGSRRSRSRPASFGDSGSSRSRSSFICASYPSRSPRSRRRQRSGSPPTTDASTINRSHFHGARRPPSTMGDSPSADRCGGLAVSGASGAVSTPANPATRSSAGGRTSKVWAASASGTCASERYSAKRMADRRSTAQLRIARKARPDGCGRRAPRSNQPLMPARSNAFSTRPRYSRGERRNTAISSKRTPPRASSRIRRAISTHSRPSPGAENSRTSPCAWRSGGCRAAKSDRRSAARSESPEGSRVSTGVPSVSR